MMATRKKGQNQSKVKSKVSKLAARRNPWINFMREFRELNKNNPIYKGLEGNQKVFGDAGAKFRALSEEDKKKYNTYINYKKDKPETASTDDDKKNRAKK